MPLRLPTLGLAALAGVAQGFSMATPWDRQPAGWLQLAALSLFVWLLNRVTRAVHAGWLGWVFSTAWLCATFWWMFVAMHTYAGLAAPLAALAVFALALALSLYYAAAMAAYVAWRPAGPWRAGLLFAGLWLLAELARANWFTGFGWGGIAYAHVDALAQPARWIGAFGVTALLAWLAHAVATGVAAPRARRGQWLAALALVAAMAWPAASFTRGTAPLSVALLQGNIAQDVKFVSGSGVEDSLRWYGQELANAKASLIVAPETAIPLLPQQLPPGYWDALRQRFAGPGQAALIGIPLGDSTQGYTNSVVGFKAGPTTGAEALPYRYDKHHLVPFGEFIPPLFRWFTEMMNIPLGDFNRGAIGQPSFEWQGQRLAPNICYEDLFGEELGARFGDAARAPTIFVNVSNIAWFGDTVAIDQHTAISRMRALEFERPFVRATNTGDTAVIDAGARVTHALPRYTRAVLTAEVQGREGNTPFAAWVSHLGLWPVWLLALAAVALGRRRRP